MHYTFSWGKKAVGWEIYILGMKSSPMEDGQEGFKSCEVPGRHIVILQLWPHSLLNKPLVLGIIFSLLQMRKVRYTEITYFAQNHTAGEW